MDARQVIEGIREKLKLGAFQNEASVSIGVVLPVLQAMGWDFSDPTMVKPEYVIDGGRVDFALFGKPGKPSAFIEVKQVGLGGPLADKQLFQYAFHAGIPLAVLTTGQEWHFYLPSGEGSYDDRRIYLLDLVERDIEESTYRLNRYISKGSIQSGAYLKNAQADYDDKTKRIEAKMKIATVWHDLVFGANPILVDEISTRVEEMTGFRPAEDDVVDFLKRQATPQPKVSSVASITSNSLPSKPKGVVAKDTIGYWFEGTFFAEKSGKDVLVSILRRMAQRDPTFLDRFDARKHGTKRRWVAKTKEALYPGRPDLQAACSEELVPGWWVGTNYSAYSEMPKIVTVAAEVFKVSYQSLNPTFSVK